MSRASGELDWRAAIRDVGKRSALGALLYSAFGGGWRRCAREVVSSDETGGGAKALVCSDFGGVEVFGSIVGYADYEERL